VITVYVPGSRRASSNADKSRHSRRLPTARQLLSQHSPMLGDWPSPDEPIHPGEDKTGIELLRPIGRHYGRTASHLGLSGLR
jgi:hypothetical protein